MEMTNLECLCDRRIGGYCLADFIARGIADRLIGGGKRIDDGTGIADSRRSQDRAERPVTPQLPTNLSGAAAASAPVRKS
jgi:hypothetical protein